MYGAVRQRTLQDERSFAVSFVCRSVLHSGSAVLMIETQRSQTAELTIADIEQLATWTLDEHGLSKIGWTFGWDRAVRRAGCCKFSQRRITLSRAIFEISVNRAAALETILHE